MEQPVEKSEFEKMVSGDLYNCVVPDLCARRARAKRHVLEYNTSVGYLEDVQVRQNHLEKLFGKVGPNCIIEPPFQVDYGENTEIGENFYSNFNVVILDWYVSSSCIPQPLPDFHPANVIHSMKCDIPNRWL